MVQLKPVTVVGRIIFKSGVGLTLPTSSFGSERRYLCVRLLFGLEIPNATKKSIDKLEIDQVARFHHVTVSKSWKRDAEIEPPTSRQFLRWIWSGELIFFGNVGFRKTSELEEFLLVAKKESLLGQWLNFKLFGITYLVGKISRSNCFFRGPLAK